MIATLGDSALTHGGGQYARAMLYTYTPVQLLWAIEVHEPPPGGLEAGVSGVRSVPYAAGQQWADTARCGGSDPGLQPPVYDPTLPHVLMQTSEQRPLLQTITCTQQQTPAMAAPQVAIVDLGMSLGAEMILGPDGFRRTGHRAACNFSIAAAAHLLFSVNTR